LNARMPTMMPKRKKMNAMTSQMTPHTVANSSRNALRSVHAAQVKKKRVISVPREGKQPQIFAKADASDVLTFRAMVSSVGVTPPIIISLPLSQFQTKKRRTNHVPKDIETRHDADEQHLSTRRSEHDKAKVRMAAQPNLRGIVVLRLL